MAAGIGSTRMDNVQETIVGVNYDFVVLNVMGMSPQRHLKRRQRGEICGDSYRLRCAN